MRFRASYDLFTNLTRDNLDVHVAPRKDDPRLYCQNTHVGGMLDCPTANLDACYWDKNSLTFGMIGISIVIEQRYS